MHSLYKNPSHRRYWNAKIGGIFRYFITMFYAIPFTFVISLKYMISLSKMNANDNLLKMFIIDSLMKKKLDCDFPLTYGSYLSILIITFIYEPIPIRTIN